MKKETKKKTVKRPPIPKKALELALKQGEQDKQDFSRLELMHTKQISEKEFEIKVLKESNRAMDNLVIDYRKENEKLANDLIEEAGKFHWLDFLIGVLCMLILALCVNSSCQVRVNQESDFALSSADSTNFSDTTMCPIDSSCLTVKSDTVPDGSLTSCNKSQCGDKCLDYPYNREETFCATCKNKVTYYDTTHVTKWTHQNTSTCIEQDHSWAFNMEGYKEWPERLQVLRIISIVDPVYYDSVWHGMLGVESNINWKDVADKADVDSGMSGLDTQKIIDLINNNRY